MDKKLSTFIIFNLFNYVLSIAPPTVERVKRQSPLSRAWEEALPGVQPFWEKHKSGPYGIVIRGWQFSRCASEQVISTIGEVVRTQVLGHQSQKLHLL